MPELTIEQKAASMRMRLGQFIINAIQEIPPSRLYYMENQESRLYYMDNQELLQLCAAYYTRFVSNPNS